MDKGLLKEIVLEQVAALQKIDLGIQRTQLDLISQYVSLPHAVVISGIRRTGKSTLLAQIIHKYYPKKAYYFNFEDERLVNFEPTDFNNLYEIFLELFGEKKAFFFDEIQNAPQWENFVRRMQDSGFKFYLTGSNASLLSKELGTKLTGRSISVELYPFSFREFLLYRGYTLKSNTLFYTLERSRIKRYFSEYLANGGMPEYLKYREINTLKMVYEDILYRDIVARYEIKEIKALRELALYLASNLTRSFTYSSLKRMLQLGSVNTVKSYVDYLENSFLFFATTRFSYSVKQQYTAPQKIYGIDNGLMGSVAFQFSKNRGLFLENLVFLELKRQYKEIYYCKTAKSLEVDFLIKKENQAISLIQVTEGLGNEITRKRELDSLLAAMEELKLKEGLILTEDYEEEIKVSKGTVRVQPIYKWLISNE